MLSVNKWTKQFVHTMLIFIHLKPYTFKAEKDIRKYIF